MFKVCRHTKTYFFNFLENANRYKIEIFRVNITFDGLSNDISLIVVAQNFIISTYISKVLTINFLEDYNSCKVETFKVN